jgi:DNA polymerase III alpha subunit (gram-positive type)
MNEDDKDEKYYADILAQMNNTLIECNAIDINTYPCVMVLDTEASLQGNLIQVAYNLYDMKFNTIQKRNYLINEGINEIDFFKKFDLETIHKHGCQARDVLEKIRTDFMKCKYLVCHNISYDCSKLRKYFQKYDIDAVFPTMICTMKESRDVLQIKNKYGNNKMPKLSELYNHYYEDELDESLCHSADFDIDVTFKCFRKLVELKVIKI